VTVPLDLAGRNGHLAYSPRTRMWLFVRCRRRGIAPNAVRYGLVSLVQWEKTNEMRTRVTPIFGIYPRTIGVPVRQNALTCMRFFYFRRFGINFFLRSRC